MALTDRRSVLSCVAALGVLLAAAPRPADAVAQLAGAPTAADSTGPLVAAVALVAWTLALWLAMTALLVLAARAPGQVGRAAAALGRRTAPAAVRRALSVALGVTVTVTGLAVPAGASTGPAGAVSAPATTGPSLDWPDLGQPVAAPTPVPPPAPAVVVVAAGDTLWALAQDHLARSGTASPTERQVAAAWPQWWAANREAVGDDPDLIHPGTVLRPPRP